MSKLGVAVSWRVVAAYWIGLIVLGLGCVGHIMAYVWLLDAAPWLFTSRRLSPGIIALTVSAGLFLGGVVKYLIPFVLRTFGAAPIDHIGIETSSGEKSVLDYAAYRKREARKAGLDRR